METVPTGSRGAVRLHLRGSRSSDDPRDTLVSSQQWTFQSQHAPSAPSFTIGSFRSGSDISTLLQLTPPTIPSFSNHLSLYPGDDAEQGSSVDADILAAQLFLQQHHPDIEIPDFVHSHVINDNAQRLEDTGHALDGSLGLSDVQAIAVLGPIENGNKHIYAVACVGGLNRDCLLLHQLIVNAKPEAGVGVAAVKQEQINHKSTTDHKGKGRELPSAQVHFVPAKEAARKYRTPILQIVAAPNGRHVIVRTHSGTSFLSLQHKASDHGHSRSRFETIHHITYGQEGYAQHQDVCFSAKSPIIAAAVDRLGNIDIIQLEGRQQQGRAREEAASASPAPVTPADDPAASGSNRRGHFTHRLSASVSNEQILSSSVVVERIRVQNHPLLAEGGEEDAPTDAHTNPQPPSSQCASYSGPFRIAFGPDERTLLVLSRHTLVQVKLDESNAASHASISPQLSTLLRSSFCVSSFRRERFFSMALSLMPGSQDALVAVCSSDKVYWIDLKEPARPLFAAAHNRGDDPTLTIVPLPQGASQHEQQGSQVATWALSSRRNNLISCYSVVVRPNMNPSTSGTHDLTVEENLSLRWRSALVDAPVLLPGALSELDKIGAPPLFLDAAGIVPEEQDSSSLLKFSVTERGMLLAQLLHRNAATPAETFKENRAQLPIQVKAPPTDTILYMDRVARNTDFPDARSAVQTQLLDYQQLHRSLFDVRRKDDKTSAVFANHVDYSVKAQSLTSEEAASTYAGTVSLGQMFRSSFRRTGPDGQQEPNGSGLERCSWSNALDIGSFDARDEAHMKAILDFRRDVRHVLPSLGMSPARLDWFGAANLLKHKNDGGGPRSPVDIDSDVLSRALSDRSHDGIALYLPTKEAVQSWHYQEQRAVQESLSDAARQMRSDLALENEVFLRPKVRLLDEGASTQRLRQRHGTNWTAFEHREIYNFVDEQGSTIPPPNIGSVGLSFFAPLRGGDVQAAAEPLQQQSGASRSLSEAELESLLPSTSFTSRLLLAEWQLDEDPSEYTYLDPFEGLHRLPRASRLYGSTARARSRSFSRASSASGDERSRSRSRSRNASVPTSYSQPDAFNSVGPSSSYPSSVVSHSQPVGLSSAAPPSLASRRKRQREAVESRSQPTRASAQGFERGTVIPPASHSASARADRPDKKKFSAAQSQPEARPFGFAGSFGDLTPTVSPSSSQVGTSTQTYPIASTQIQAGRFGARPTKPDRPQKKKKRASGF